ncbi:RNA polymerase factor sigma-54 [Gammaproteobacteria bacterium]|jgi:RNA polymerase sigma-54 factor|nr:RNA polymerase factor sigma-54 [Pseudomonadota bacterium]MDA8958465.1 RNA polymerase factor sigma-54 [Gammaproteobacteria bacterium]MDA9835057.1 RNA polymerase factor sigma-54 [Gammaproteobacteria bacterium]MDA9917348.1 RNA polymerase factor sigma-54 [Gammaproteobacteria bacterium]MDA9978727.1 RNA polymerase factor sigma-54 [Gammaproteobacteria bacterium]
MAIKLVREFQQKQHVAITPQLKKSIDLLQLSRVEIINKIHAEAEDNPFLIKESEEDVSFNYYNNNDDDGLLSNLAEIVTLQNSLESQVNDLNLSKSKQEIAMTLIQSLDESGLLRLNSEELEGLFNHRIQIDKILDVLVSVIHNLEPAGIGARDFKELILLQLKRKNLAQSQLQLIKEILYNPTFHDFKEAQNELQKKFPLEEISIALDLIKSCDLSPGLDFQSTQYIQADIEIIPSEGNLTICFVEENFPKLRFDKELESLTKESEGSIQLKEKILDAKWLIRSINKRNETVQKVGTLICQKQSKFLLNESIQLNSISNLELAKELLVSPSTISRILRSKYIQTPNGIVLMKTLLSASVSKTKKVTPTQLMEEIKEIILNSSNNLSDQKITELLNRRGFGLARRTIAKYRAMLLIPNSRKR